MGSLAGRGGGRELLGQAVANLLDNALKYGAVAADAEGVAPPVTVTAARQDGLVTITVADRGPGIPGDQLDAAMQPFYRLEQSRNRETGGTGLGLAIAQQLATAIGGSIRLYNREGGGLAAEVVIP